MGKKCINQALEYDAIHFSKIIGALKNLDGDILTDPYFNVGVLI